MLCQGKVSVCVCVCVCGGGVPVITTHRHTLMVSLRVGMTTHVPTTPNVATDETDPQILQIERCNIFIPGANKIKVHCILQYLAIIVVRSAW